MHRSLRSLCKFPAALRQIALPQRLVSSSSVCLADTEFGIYPGNNKLQYVSELDTRPPSEQPRMTVYRIMNEDGTIRKGQEVPADMDKDTLLNAYKTMVRLQSLDAVFYDAQRQGRISFYMQNSGEEATHIGSAMALRPDDEVFAQYREAGVLMYRGFTLQQFADQCFSNADDLGKGRQMPVHYGSRDLHFHTISSPLATQLPQATGAAYAIKNSGDKDRIAIVYFGEGAASEGDAHAAMNFAATLKCPMIFFCRNNGFAISTPVKDQYAGDGIAARGVAYGMHTLRIDGNDIFAVREAVRTARKIATTESRPVMIEAMTYREGHHSTSDDSTQYRSTDEIKTWHESSNPVNRLRAYLEAQGWWTGEEEEALRKTERKAVLKAMTTAEKKHKPGMEDVFSDVYDQMPPHLAAQEAQMKEHVAKYPGQYDLNSH